MMNPPLKGQNDPPILKVLIEHVCNQKRGQFIEEMWLPPLVLGDPQVQIVRKTYQNPTS